MIRRAALALCLTAALATGGRADEGGPAERARAAAEALAGAIAALESATGGRDQVAALSRTILAYEEGMAALRDALRQATIRETALTMRFEARSERVSQLLGVLSGIRADPGPLLLLHPTGPLGTARSGMMLAEVTPALQAEADTLRAELQEVAALRESQAAAAAALERGLTAAQLARTALSQAIADRGELPRRFIDDPETLRALVEDVDTLDTLTFALRPDLDAALGDDSVLDFEGAQGRLPLPVFGTLLRRAGEADAAGIHRPGLVIATRPHALVSAPWAGTIRYRGPLLDYGNVMILEPGAGYLLVLAGLGTVYGEVGEVVARGAPLGLMGGVEPGAQEFWDDLRNGTGASGSETLYIEIRQGAEPVDPSGWFAGTREQGGE